MSERKERFTLGQWTFDPYTGFVDSLVSEDEEGANYESVCEVSGAIGDPNGYLIAAAPKMYEFVHFFETVAGQVILLAAQKSGMKKEAHEIYEEAIRICKKARGEE